MRPVSEGHNTDLDSRLSRLEGLFERFVDEWRTDRDGLKTAIDSLRADIGQDLRSRGAVNWGAVSVMVTAVALAGALIGYIVNDVNTDLQTHIESDGHPSAMISAGRQEVAIERLQHDTARLEGKLGEVLRTRWTIDDHLSIVAPFILEEKASTSALQSHVGAIDNRLDKIEAEQIRRTNRVYDSEP